MEDRTRRILVGLACAVGAITVSAGTASAQSGSSTGGSQAPKSTAPFDDSPSSGSSTGPMPGGCSGMHMPDDGGAATAAQLT
jgi:hypothetical protein